MNTLADSKPRGAGKSPAARHIGPYPQAFACAVKIGTVFFGGFPGAVCTRFHGTALTGCRLPARTATKSSRQRA